MSNHELGGQGEYVTLREHLEALRVGDDRRYQEVAAEREKALRIKEMADEKALLLAREIQTYKDEKANDLRSQIESERGVYVTRAELIAAVEKIDATVKPLVDYVSAQHGGAASSLNWQTVILALLALAAILIAPHIH